MTTETIFTFDNDGHLTVRPVGPEQRLDDLEQRLAALERTVAALPDKAAATVSRELSAAVQSLRTDRG